MIVDAQKGMGIPVLTVSFRPESGADEDFLKVLMMTVVEGGKIRVDNKEGERAIMRWDGISGARINRHDDEGGRGDG